MGGRESLPLFFFFSCLLWDRETVQWPTLISHPHSACAHGRHPPTPTLAKTMYYPKPLYLVLLSLSLSIYTLFVTFLIRVHSACMLFSHPPFLFLYFSASLATRVWSSFFFFKDSSSSYSLLTRFLSSFHFILNSKSFLLPKRNARPPPSWN